jgi:radical SAM protein with 4Fe4S-binding SPASM domain
VTKRAGPQTERKAKVLSEKTCIPKPISMDGFLATPIPPGVFSRRYSLPNSEVACVAYHTPSQSVVFLQGDSAEVWWQIYTANGDCESALQYIQKNGTFDDAEKGSRDVLTGFLEDLRHSNLIGEGHGCAPHESCVALGTDPEQNPELEIGQFMADHHVLYSLVLELTYRCNERCVHCYLPSDTRTAELTTLQIESLLQEFNDLGGMQLQLTGGELFARNDILEILRSVKARGFAISVTSNLTLMTDEILGALADLHPRSVGCSIYGPTAELHDSVTTIKGSFDKSIRAIRALRSAGIPVVMKSPLLRSTAPHWREIERLAQDLDCEYQFDLSITAKNDGGLSPVSHRVEDSAVLKDILASRYYKLYAGDEPMSTLTSLSPDAGLCGAGAAGLCISPDGTVRPCIGLNVPMGRWPETALSEIWHTSKFFSEFGAIRLQDIPQCRDCTDFAYCSRCPGAWHAEHGDYCKPTTYACKLAHVWAEVQRDLPASRKGDQT